MTNRFSKPEGTGAALSPYMFLPHRLVHATMVLLTSPRYFGARLRTLIYQARHPDHPWLTKAANTFLDDFLRSGMKGFEWGSGRSTLWFVGKGVTMASVEDDRAWYEKLTADLSGDGVDYHYVDPAEGGEAYAGKIDGYPDESFDMVVVDGSHRDACIRHAVSKVRRGGVVVVDNAEQSITVSPLASFRRIETDNGVWRTDLFVRDSD